MADSTTTSPTPPTPPDKGEKAKGLNLKPYLRGLAFRTNKAIEMKDENGKPILMGGKPRLTYIPVEREMQEGDVLSHAVVGDEIVLITKDGRKYRIQK